MGQKEIYQFLNDHVNEWFTYEQLMKIMNLECTSFQKCVNKLKIYDEIITKNSFASRNKDRFIMLKR